MLLHTNFTDVGKSSKKKGDNAACVVQDVINPSLREYRVFFEEKEQSDHVIERGLKSKQR